MATTILKFKHWILLAAAASSLACPSVFAQDTGLQPPPGAGAQPLPQDAGQPQIPAAPLKRFPDSENRPLQDVLGLSIDKATDFMPDPHEIENDMATVNQAKVTIEGALTGLKRWDYPVAENRLSTALADALHATDGQKQNTLLRTALERGRLFKNLLERTRVEGAIGVQDAKVEALWRSLKFAKAYAQFDSIHLDKELGNATVDPESPLAYMEFGLNYNEFVSELTDSVVSARAQFVLTYMTAGWLAHDLKTDKIGAGKLAVSRVKLAHAQLYLLSFFNQAISADPGIAPHQYIAATKEIREGIQEALASATEVPRPQFVSQQVLYGVE